MSIDDRKIGHEMREPTTPRRGRPRATEVGEVDERILTVAHRLFLRDGFARTTYDRLAVEARTSKTTLYNRFPSKENLFDAVVARSLSDLTADIVERISAGSRRDALLDVGIALADATLTPESIALMRVTAAEAVSLPAVAREGFRIGFGACARAMAVAIAGVEDTDAVSEAMPAAQRFVELALHPLYVHAFFGADLAKLRERARRDVEQVLDCLPELGVRCEVVD